MQARLASRAQEQWNQIIVTLISIFYSLLHGRKPCWLRKNETTDHKMMRKLFVCIVNAMEAKSNAAGHLKFSAFQKVWAPMWVIA
jgi:hypothetical protein